MTFLNHVYEFLGACFTATMEWLLVNYPYVILYAIVGFLIILARRFKTHPTRLTCLLLVFPLAATVAGVVVPLFFWVAILFDIVFLGVLIIDLAIMPTFRGLTIERDLNKTVSIDKQHPVTLVATNRSRREYRIWLRDDLPQELVPNQELFEEVIPASSRIKIHYYFQAKKRGKFSLERIYLKMRSRLGLWQRFKNPVLENSVNVYPDLQQLGEYALLARKNKLNMLGLRRTRRIGQDNEFERLRDYTSDDNFKHIDWRTTARRNKLTVRDFQANQSQRVIFMLDCGRMMTNEAAGLNLLDHALNATLMLSYIALQKGDAVGLICFSDRVHTYVPPKAGMKQMNQLLYAMYDRDPDLVESRYDLAFLHLATNCLRRSLVVLVTNVIDEVNSMQIERYLSTLVGRHLPLGVLLRDHQLFDAADREPNSVEEIYQSAVAAEIASWRQQVLTDLEHKGVISLDVFPEDMTAPLINQYLEIKARHLL